MATKVIGLVGAEKYDIVRCLADLLHGLGYRILVVDATWLQYTMSSVPPFLKHDLVEFCEIHFAASPEVELLKSWELSERYDYILLDADLGETLIKVFTCFQVFYIVDALKAHIDYVRSQICESANNDVVLIRDIVFPQTLRNDMDTLLAAGLVKEQLVIFAENQKERSWRLNIPYQYQLPIKLMSKQYRLLLHCLLSIIVPITGKEYKKLLKQIGRSKR